MKIITATTLFVTAAMMGSTVSSAALAGDTRDAQQDVALIRDVQPAFPESALRRMTDGYVVVQFDVSDNGKAHNIRIVDSQPEHTFDGAVATAIRRSHFNVDTEVKDLERVYRFDAPDGEMEQQVGMFNAFHQ